MNGHRAKHALWMAGLVTLGFLLRTTNAAEVFVGGLVVLPANDPYYQVHRVFETLAAYPWVPLVDPLLDHPFGAAPIWPPVFPWLLATLVHAVGLGGSSAHGIETFLAFTTPVVGALVCVPVYALARRILDGPGAWLAATVAVLVPAHLWYSRLGFVDHHALVTLVQVCLFLGALVSLTERRSGLLCGALAFGMMLWNGFVLFVGVLDLFFLVAFFLSDLDQRRHIARVVARSHGFAALVVLPIAAASAAATGAPFGAFALSYVHPLVLVVVAVLAALIAHVPARAGLAAVLLGVAAAWVGVASGAAVEASRWLLARDDFMASIQEAVPIFLRADGSLDLVGPTIWLTRFWFVVPIALAVLARSVVRSERMDLGRLLLLVWGTSLFLLALRQRRFAEAFAPALAILVAWALVALRSAALDATERAHWGRSTGQVVTALGLVLVLAVGLGPYYVPLVRNPTSVFTIAHAAPAPEASRAVPPSHRALERLRDVATGGPRSESGVLNLWPLGHRVLYLTGLPVVASPFGSHLGSGSYAESAEFFLSTEESVAVERMERRGLRYVVVDNDLGTLGAALGARGIAPQDFYRREKIGEGAVRTEYQRALYETMYLRLVLLAGAGEPAYQIPALRHFRLVADSPGEHHPGNLKVFERVAGAQLVLRASPERTYDLVYAFRSDLGRERTHVIRVESDAAGRARVRLPYSSERADLGHETSWILRDEHGAELTRLRVPEEAVVMGTRIELDVSAPTVF